MVEDISRNWFVLYTKPRNELKVAERLRSNGVEAYTPTRTEVRQWSDRKKKVLVPLLPSIVLVSLQDKQVDQAFEVPGVVRYLFEHGKRAKVSNQEMLAMQRYLENTYLTTQKELEVGDTVKVPLLEQEVTLLSIKGKKCLGQLQKLGAIVSFQLQ